MKRIFKSVLILLVGICLSVNLNSQSLTTGLVAYYKMDEVSDSVLTETPFKLNGFSNGAVPNQSGILGTSYLFDGTNDYIEIPYRSNYMLYHESNSITLSAWVNPTITTGYREIVTKLHEVGTNTSPYFSYQLSLFPASTGLSPRFSITTNGTNKYAYDNSIVLTPNQWSHILGTYDGANMRLYLNGVLIATSVASGNITNFNAPLYIGATGAITEVFQGRIDEVGIWSRNFSLNDVLYLYNGGDGISYPFNEEPEEPVLPTECEVDVAYLFENNVDDSGTLSINGILKGGATYSTSGDSYEGDYSLRFQSSGQTSERRMISSAPVNLSSGNGLTVSLWAKIENSGQYPALFMNKAGGINTTGLSLGTDLSTREVFLNVANGSTNDAILTNSAAYTFGEWTHLVFRFMDEDAQYANIWINGVLATEADSSLSITDWGKNDTICIGGYRVATYPFTGNIDNVQIYRKGLSANDIQTLYEEGASFYKVGCDTVPVHYVAETNLNDVIWYSTFYNVPERENTGDVGSPIGIHPSNPHYFIYNNTATVVVTSGEHYGAVLNTDFDYITYLNTLQDDHLNGTRISIGTAVEYQGWYNILQNTWAPASGKYLAPWARSGTSGYYGGGNKFDFSDWDEAYFQRLKDFIAAAQERDIFVEVMLFSAVYNDDLWNYSPFKASNNLQGIGPSTRTNLLNLSNSATTNVQKDVVAKIVTELNSYNNVWYEICNEPYLGNASNAWQDTVLAVIRRTELSLPKRHLVSRNVANYYSNISPTLSPDIDIWNFHYAREARAYLDNLDLNKIIGNNETGFSQADSQYRREAYVALLSGAGLFNSLDYSFTVNDETGQVVPAGNPAGGGPALRSQLGQLRYFIEQAPDITEMIPSHSVITGLSAGTNGYCLRNSTGYFNLIFIRGTDGTFNIALPSGEYQVIWDNTKTGNVIQETYSNSGTGLTLTAPTYTEDIAARIQRLGDYQGSIDLNNFNLIVNKTFDDYPGGTFPGTYLGNLTRNSGSERFEVVTDPHDPTNKCLRIRAGDVNYSLAVDIKVLLPTGIKEVYFTYDWWQGLNYQPTKTQKMPGLGGNPWQNIDPVNPPDAGWIHRQVTGYAGQVFSYYYDHHPTTPYNMNSTYPPYDNATAWGGYNQTYMNPGNKYTITERVVMNSGPTTSNGVYECWVDGRRILAQNNRRYWNNYTGKSPYIDYWSITHFYGGQSAPYFPSEMVYGYVDNIKVWTPKSPVKSGNSIHSTTILPYNPNIIADKEFLYDELVTVEGTLQNSEYGSNYTTGKDESWLIDAGPGKTVTFTYTYGLHSDVYGLGDMLLIYDGNETDDELLRAHTGAVITTPVTVTSTGRYMFIRFATDKEYNNIGFTGTLTFN